LAITLQQPDSLKTLAGVSQTSPETQFSGGLASGRSLGSTLKDLGLSDQESKAARKRAEDEIKQAKKMK
jgi:hypothetical protein